MCAVSRPSLTEFAVICSRLCADSTFSMTAANNASVGVGGVLWFLLPNSVDEYIHNYSGCVDGHRFFISPAGQLLTVFIYCVEHETLYACWRRGCKHWGGRRADDDHTHDKFVYTCVVRSLEEAPYEKRPTCLISKLCADGFTWMAAD